MAISDPIADFLTKIRNASSARKATVEVKSSKVLVKIAQILTEEGYLKGYKEIEDPVQNRLQMELKYDEKGQGAITEISRISRPSRRIYNKAARIPKTLGGLGISIITTSKGLMTDQQARQQNVGGEVICRVW